MGPFCFLGQRERTMPDPRYEVLSVRFERELLARVRKLAHREERAAGALIRLAVRAYLDAHK